MTRLNLKTTTAPPKTCFILKLCVNCPGILVRQISIDVAVHAVLCFCTIVSQNVRRQRLDDTNSRSMRW